MSNAQPLGGASPGADSLVKRPYSLSLFVPVYNCEPRQLIRNVACIHEFVGRHWSSFEIIIVDDNSSEATRKAIEQAVLQSGVSVIRYPEGPSRRENLASSFSRSNYEVLSFIDIDLATPLPFLPLLTDAIHKGYDIVVGSRGRGIKPTRQFSRRIISSMYNAFLKWMFRSRIADHTCGCKAFRKNAIVQLVEDMGADRSAARGWFWDAEMLIRAQHAGMRIAELPVEWRAASCSTFLLSREIKLIPYAVSFWRVMRKVRRRSGVTDVISGVVGSQT